MLDITAFSDVQFVLMCWKKLNLYPAASITEKLSVSVEKCSWRVNDNYDLGLTMILTKSVSSLPFESFTENSTLYDPS